MPPGNIKNFSTYLAAGEYTGGFEMINFNLDKTPYEENHEPQTFTDICPAIQGQLIRFTPFAVKAGKV
jgi:hypothetical protein